MESNTSDSGRGGSESDVQTGSTIIIPKSKELGIKITENLYPKSLNHIIHVICEFKIEKEI
jgi:hypothetical protein